MELITQQADGPLAGFCALSLTPEQKTVFIAKWRAILAYFDSLGTDYGMGCKVRDITAPVPVMVDPDGDVCNKLDCSGFFRYALYHAMLAATGQGLVIPDGSYSQNEWFGQRGFKHGDHDAYLQAGGNKDGIFRACFCKSEDGHAYGHVWGDYDGVTGESYGGNGPGSRPWNAPVLERIVDDYYCLC